MQEQRAQCSDIHHLLIGVEHTESEQSTPVRLSPTTDYWQGLG